MILETVRLRLREFTSDDLDALAAMFADPEQMRFYSRMRTRDESRCWLDRHIAMYETHGFGIWAIEFQANATFAGYCGIRPLDLDSQAETEIAWRVEKTHWGQGIATEAATAVRDWFEGRRLVALIPPHHEASRRVAKKIGMSNEGTAVIDGDPLAVYART